MAAMGMLLSLVGNKTAKKVPKLDTQTERYEEGKLISTLGTLLVVLEVVFLCIHIFMDVECSLVNPIVDALSHEFGNDKLVAASHNATLRAEIALEMRNMWPVREDFVNLNCRNERLENTLPFIGSSLGFVISLFIWAAVFAAFNVELNKKASQYPNLPDDEEGDEKRKKLHISLHTMALTYLVVKLVALATFVAFFYVTTSYVIDQEQNGSKFMNFRCGDTYKWQEHVFTIDAGKNYTCMPTQGLVQIILQFIIVAVRIAVAIMFILTIITLFKYMKRTPWKEADELRKKHLTHHGLNKGGAIDKLRAAANNAAADGVVPESGKSFQLLKSEYLRFQFELGMVMMKVAKTCVQHPKRMREPVAQSVRAAAVATLDMLAQEETFSAHDSVKQIVPFLIMLATGGSFDDLPAEVGEPLEKAFKLFMQVLMAGLTVSAAQVSAHALEHPDGEQADEEDEDGAGLKGTAAKLLVKAKDLGAKGAVKLQEVRVHAVDAGATLANKVQEKVVEKKMQHVDQIVQAKEVVKGKGLLTEKADNVQQASQGNNFQEEEEALLPIIGDIPVPGTTVPRFM